MRKLVIELCDAYINSKRPAGFGSLIGTSASVHLAEY
jgi:hypothetical protein